MGAKTVFKKGDRVFEYRQGWGSVVNIIGGTHWHGVVVEFDNSLSIATQMDSFYLSFTEYKLEGFTQSPEIIPEKGQVVWVKDEEDEEWVVAHFINKEGRYYMASYNNNESRKFPYRLITTISPFENKESDK
jgi:hypothetical protein